MKIGTFEATLKIALRQVLPDYVNDTEAQSPEAEGLKAELQAELKEKFAKALGPGGSVQVEDISFGIIEVAT